MICSGYVTHVSDPWPVGLLHFLLKSYVASILYVEVPSPAVSKAYPQHMFLRRNIQIPVYFGLKNELYLEISLNAIYLLLLNERIKALVNWLVHATLPGLFCRAK